jgi:hypothetical protein
MGLKFGAAGISRPVLGYPTAGQGRARAKFFALCGLAGPVPGAGPEHATRVCSLGFWGYTLGRLCGDNGSYGARARLACKVMSSGHRSPSIWHGRRRVTPRTQYGSAHVALCSMIFSNNPINARRSLRSRQANMLASRATKLLRMILYIFWPASVARKT